MSIKKLHWESNPRNVAPQPTAPPHTTFTTSNLTTILADSRIYENTSALCGKNSDSNMYLCVTYSNHCALKG